MVCLLGWNNSTLERLIEWVDRNYPADRYFSPEDRFADVEMRFNSDGNEMNDTVRQLLLDHFTLEYEPEYRDMQQREEEQRQIQEVITGSRELPSSLADQIVEDLNRPEIMGIDMSQFRTDREYVTPPIIERFTRQTGLGKLGVLVSRARSFFGRLLGK